MSHLNWVLGGNSVGSTPWLVLGISGNYIGLGSSLVRRQGSWYWAHAFSQCRKMACWSPLHLPKFRWWWRIGDTSACNTPVISLIDMCYLAPLIMEGFLQPMTEGISMFFVVATSTKGTKIEDHALYSSFIVQKPLYLNAEESKTPISLKLLVPECHQQQTASPIPTVVRLMLGHLSALCSQQTNSLQAQNRRQTGIMIGLISTARVHASTTIVVHLQFRGPAKGSNVPSSSRSHAS